MNLSFFFEVLIGGLLSGVMYALVALGFVLIYKASGVFNFAQGAMVFFAALTCVGIATKFNVSLWIAIPLTMAAMVLLGLAIEKIVLRPLVNQPEITLFMATIGLSFFIEGLAQMMWGSEVRKLELPIEDVPIKFLFDKFNIAISQFDSQWMAGEQFGQRIEIRQLVRFWPESGRHLQQEYSKFSRLSQRSKQLQ